jgi:cytochrome oxidase assembly protein ShyY1
MLALGFWQLERMEQKQQRLLNIVQKQELTPVHPADMTPEGDDIRDLPVRFEGQLDSQHVVFLDNQVFQGVVGYQVLAPVTSRNINILVNLGWVADMTYRQSLPNVELPSVTEVYQGRIALPSKNPMVLETATAKDVFPLRLQKLDLDLIAQAMNKDLLPFIVQLEAPTYSQFSRDWKPVVMSPEKHLGYAIQWFGLAIVAVFIFLIVLVRRSHE